ncbi:MAG TPA: purine-binding chemotaxis protein CheW [Clostridiaceae bacterium]|nr:purine-binding chemotaxis protein CheW [Clostridiaceae bacterium]
MASRQLVIFNVGDEEFGVDISYVNSIERPLKIFKIPNVPEYIEGLINLRGKVYSVISLRKRFNLPVKEFDDLTKIIMVSANSSIVGFIVDAVSEIIKVDDADIEDTSSVLNGNRKRFVNGVAKVNERVIMLVDLNAVIFEPEENAYSPMRLQSATASN